MKSKKKSLVKESVNFLLDILIVMFGIVLLITIYTSVQTKILNNDYNDFFGYSMFEVQTGSMADEINAGDWVVVKLTQNVGLNDIITYELEDKYITHRIVEVYNGTYITKGDANTARDEPIDQSRVVGKVVRVLGNFGIIRKTFFNLGVLITFIITLFLFNLAFMKNKKEKNDNSKNRSLIFTVIIKRIRIFFKNVKKLLKKKTKNKVEPKCVIQESEGEEADLEKTSLYRVVPVDVTDVDNKFEDLEQKVDEDEYKEVKEEDLGKTSLYRKVPVDADDVDEDFKGLVRKIEKDEYKDEKEEDLEKTAIYSQFSPDMPGKDDIYKDDDLEKTSLYRVIPVDATEIDDTRLEIAKNEMKESEKAANKKAKTEELEQKTKEEEESESDESLTKIDLDFLKTKKSNNVIEKAMVIKKEELNEIIDLLLNDAKAYVKKVTVKNMFIDMFIYAKYYNYYEKSDLEYRNKNSTLKIKKVILDYADNLNNNYTGKDKKYSEIVKIHTDILVLIDKLERAMNSISDIKSKREFYKKEILNYTNDLNPKAVENTVNTIIDIQKKYISALEEFLKKLDTNMFDLNFNKLSSRKNMYGLELEHNISFSNVYSDYIIDKTYTEGIVAEDKMAVLLNLLSIEIVKDMVTADFDKKYILYFPNSLYEKNRKFKQLLNMFDDEYSKDNVIILTTFEELLSNKKIIKEVRKKGYKFALIFDKETVIKAKDRASLNIVNYIFVNKKVVDVVKMRSFIPEELLENMIDEDITDKIGDFGSD